jgi:hypothetical protein
MVDKEIHRKQNKNGRQRDTQKTKDWTTLTSIRKNSMNYETTSSLFSNLIVIQTLVINKIMILIKRKPKTKTKEKNTKSKKISYFCFFVLFFVIVVYFVFF